MRERETLIVFGVYWNIVIRSAKRWRAEKPNDFSHFAIHRNAVAMCILQIGEISKQFSQEFLSSNSQIPWKLIARTRDLYAHHYGAVDFELLWETAVGDIPEVTRFCRSYLEG